MTAIICFLAVVLVTVGFTVTVWPGHAHAPNPARRMPQWAPCADTHASPRRKQGAAQHTAPDRRPTHGKTIPSDDSRE